VIARRTPWIVRGMARLAPANGRRWTAGVSYHRRRCIRAGPHVHELPGLVLTGSIWVTQTRAVWLSILRHVRASSSARCYRIFSAKNLGEVALTFSWVARCSRSVANRLFSAAVNCRDCSVCAHVHVSSSRSGSMVGLRSKNSRNSAPTFWAWRPRNSAHLPAKCHSASSLYHSAGRSHTSASLSSGLRPSSGSTPRRSASSFGVGHPLPGSFSSRRRRICLRSSWSSGWVAESKISSSRWSWTSPNDRANRPGSGSQWKPLRAHIYPPPFNAARIVITSTRDLRPTLSTEAPQRGPRNTQNAGQTAKRLHDATRNQPASPHYSCRSEPFLPRADAK